MPFRRLRGNVYRGPEGAGAVGVQGAPYLEGLEAAGRLSAVNIGVSLVVLLITALDRKLAASDRGAA
jgi:hypothetical protein